MVFLLLLLGLVLLTLGAEALVRGASALALRLGVSPLFVGLTIVGFGTSSPELAASVAATLGGSSDIAVGNVIGSNILNIALILGLTATVSPIIVQLRAIRSDLLIALAAAFVPLLALITGGVIPRWLGVLLVAALVLYLVLAYRAGRRAGAAERQLATAELERSLLASTPPTAPSKPPRLWLHSLLIIGGLALLIVGSRTFVFAAIDLARSLGMSERVIGLTIVAAGTSMPELVTSLIAAIRRSTDIAVGNVIGSNIFNLLGILGVAAAIAPQTVAPAMLSFDTPVMIAATLALLPLMRTGGRISRIEGMVLLLAYGGYIAALVAV